MKISGRIFLLDDDEFIGSMLAKVLRKEGYETQVHTDARGIIPKISAFQPDLVLLDLALGDGLNGIDILGEIKDSQMSTQVVMITADDSAESAIKAMKLGAADYLTKPFNVDEVKIVIQKVIEKERLQAEVNYLRHTRSVSLADEMIGESAVIQELRTKVQKLAQAQVQNVIITGESGTGKEVLARYFHNQMQMFSGVDHLPFVAVNCTALPDHLVESEMFGHTKGAFTDAKSDKKGLFELANGGTILLDEIGDMPTNLQSKLLRVLEDRKVRRIGGKVDLAVDVTVIATTNKNLDEAVEAGFFRTDLYYRLNTFALHMPPLRERKDDIPVLTRFFFKSLTQNYLKETSDDVSPEAEQILCAYDWPGNIRELRNVVERIVVLEDAEIIRAEHLPLELTGGRFKRISETTQFILPKEGICLEALEKSLISQALERAENNRTNAAKLLNISYDSFRYQIKKFGFG